MATIKDLRYIKYCLSQEIYLDFAKEKLLKLIQQDKQGDGRLYALLAEFAKDEEERQKIYEKGLMIDAKCPQIYWGMFSNNLSKEEYEEAKVNLQRYKKLLEDKDMYCNKCLLDILLDELLNIEGQEYFVDNYYNTMRLKDEKYEEYCKIFLALQDEDYETAVNIAEYLEDTYEEIHMGLVIQLLKAIILKKEKSFQKVKVEV